MIHSPSLLMINLRVCRSDLYDFIAWYIKNVKNDGAFQFALALGEEMQSFLCVAFDLQFIIITCIINEWNLTFIYRLDFVWQSCTYVNLYRELVVALPPVYRYINHHTLPTSLACIMITCIHGNQSDDLIYYCKSLLLCPSPMHLHCLDLN